MTIGRRGAFIISNLVFHLEQFQAFLTKVNKHINDMVLKDHLETKDLPFYGAYFLRAPLLFLKDVDLIKQITIKDSEYFVNRNPSHFHGIRKTDQLADNILTLFQARQGQFDPQYHAYVFTLHKSRARLTKIGDLFLSLFDLPQKSHL